MDKNEINEKLQTWTKTRSKATSHNDVPMVNRANDMLSHYKQVLTDLYQHPDWGYYEFPEERFVGYRKSEYHWEQSSGKEISFIDSVILETLWQGENNANSVEND